MTDKDIIILPQEIPNPMYHSMEVQKTVSIKETKKFDAVNHHDDNPQHIYKENEQTTKKE